MARSRWSWLPTLALLVAVAGALLLAIAGPGYRAGWFTLGTALRQLLTWGAYAGIAAAVLALAALVLNGRRSGTRGLLTAIAALVLGLGTLFIPWRFQQAARSVPPIHDISTDTVTPPQYVEVAAIRRDLKAPNSLDYSAEVAARQQAGYPDLGPLFLSVPPSEAYRRALSAVEARGWDIVAAEDTGRRIEATDTTFWFGFKDDVAIRVAAMPDGGSRVDVRSVSRVGLSDVGTNARRIREFLADLSERQ